MHPSSAPAQSPAAADGTHPLLTVREIRLTGTDCRPDAFARRRVILTLTAPDGSERSLPVAYDGDGAWVARWTPERPGAWHERIDAVPADETLAHRATVEVAPGEGPAPRGFVRATPERNWGFSYDDGSPALVVGDTVYNLFGMAHCGLDVEGFLRRRAEQGFTLLRIRVPVSPWHPETATSDWQTRSCFPWGGSEQAPRFDRFDHDYFRTADRVVELCGELGLGIELICEAWGFDAPFNDRARFTADWEDLWLRFLVARYDAYPQVWMYTPMNEYEQYPDGQMAHTLAADLWLLRTARRLAELGCHGHPVVCHNGPPDPPFAGRWDQDPGAIDGVMFQHWGTFDAEHGWLTEGIEEQMEASFAGYTGSRVLAEWGYERNPALDLDVPWHEHMGLEHTRRGAWRAVFAAMGYIHGFENSWGPWALLDDDQAGIEDLVMVCRILEEHLPWPQMAAITDPAGELGLEHAAPDVATSREDRAGLRPRALATADRATIAVYLPAGGTVTLPASLRGHAATWIDPRTGETSPATTDAATADAGTRLVPPRTEDRDARSGVVGDGGHRADWILLLAAPARAAS